MTNEIVEYGLCSQIIGPLRIYLLLQNKHALIAYADLINTGFWTMIIGQEENKESNNQQ